MSTKSHFSVLGSSKVGLSLEFLASLQTASGMIPWFKGGRADPWNHSEGAIALAMGGRLEEAIRAADWLLGAQNGDGSWCHFYLSQGVAEPRRDTNTCSYAVLLVSLLDLLVDDKMLLTPYVEMALSGIDYVLRHQRSDGSIPWAVDPDGLGYPKSLVAASSSIFDSIAIAAMLNDKFQLRDPKIYEDSRKILGDSLIELGEAYQDTSNWAMDHYYPVLAGIDRSSNLTRGFLDQFYVQGWGIKCRLPNSWFTVAETAETAMAFHILGEEDLAHEIFSTIGKFRESSGGYLTGLVAPDGVSFPLNESSAYSVAAVVIASFIIGSKAERSLGRAILQLFS